MTQGKDIIIFKTEDDKFKFAVLICGTDYLIEASRLIDCVNFIFNPSYNEDIKEVQRQADIHCKNFNFDVMITNVKRYGGTCIIAKENKNIINRLTEEGYRIRDDIIYKLCETNKDEEMIIIADISLKHRTVSTPINDKPRIKIIGRYRFINGCWN